MHVAYNWKVDRMTSKNPCTQEQRKSYDVIDKRRHNDVNKIQGQYCKVIIKLLMGGYCKIELLIKQV